MQVQRSNLALQTTEWTNPVDFADFLGQHPTIASCLSKAEVTATAEALWNGKPVPETQLARLGQLPAQTLPIVLSLRQKIHSEQPRWRCSLTIALSNEIERHGLRRAVQTLREQIHAFLESHAEALAPCGNTVSLAIDQWHGDRADDELIDALAHLLSTPTDSFMLRLIPPSCAEAAADRGFALLRRLRQAVPETLLDPIDISAADIPRAVEDAPGCQFVIVTSIDRYSLCAIPSDSGELPLDCEPLLLEEHREVSAARFVIGNPDTVRNRPDIALLLLQRIALSTLRYPSLRWREAPFLLLGRSATALSRLFGANDFGYLRFSPAADNRRLLQDGYFLSQLCREKLSLDGER